MKPCAPEPGPKNQNSRSPINSPIHFPNGIKVLNQ